MGIGAATPAAGVSTKATQGVGGKTLAVAVAALSESDEGPPTPPGMYGT